MSDRGQPRPGLSLATAACLGIFWWLAATLAANGGDVVHPRLWLTIGVYFGFAVVSPARSWPLLGAAVLIADVLRIGPDAYGWRPFAGWASDTAGVIATAAVCRRRSTVTRGEDRRLLLLGAVLAPAISAVLFQLAGRVIPMPDAVPVLLRFSSCSLGVLAVTPFILALRDLLARGITSLEPRVALKGALLLVLVVIVARASYSSLLPPAARMPYLIYPVLVLIALQGRMGLTAAANFAVTLLMLHGAQIFHSGPLASESLVESTTRLHILVGITIFTHMVLTHAVADRIAAENAAAEANQTKSRFLANISHEIRSPLSAMLGFVDLILDGNGVSDEKRRYAEVIGRNGRHLHELIDQLLDLSKVEAGRFEPSRGALDVRQLVGDVAVLVGVKAQEKNLKLQVDVSARTPPALVSDALRLRQILLNVVGNAIKFTSQGRVRLAVDAEVVQDRWRLRCEIEDTGIGLGEAERDRLFRAFSQADGSIAARYGGTGLGLVLSRRLARLLGGDLELLRSEPGVGSVFLATVDGGSVAEVEALAANAPARIAEVTPVRRQGATAALAATRVLVADDSPDSRLLTSRMLQLNGATVDPAGDGREAVTRALANDYDLILMDLQMPVLGGLEAMRELKARGYRRPIVALTGHAMPEEIKACLDAGFDGHLPKPLDRQTLVRTVRALAKDPPAISTQ